MHLTYVIAVKNMRLCNFGKKGNRSNLTKMERATFTDFDAFRATNPQVDGQWLINGGSNWCWITDSLAVGQSFMVRSYLHTGVITEGVESSDAYHFYTPFKSGIWRNFGVGFNNDEVLIVEPGAEYCTTTNTAEGWHGFIVPRHLVPLDPATRGDRARYAYTVKDQQRRSLQDARTFREPDCRRQRESGCRGFAGRTHGGSRAEGPFGSPPGNPSRRAGKPKSSWAPTPFSPGDRPSCGGGHRGGRQHAGARVGARASRGGFRAQPSGRVQ